MSKVEDTPVSEFTERLNALGLRSRWEPRGGRLDSGIDGVLALTIDGRVLTRRAIVRPSVTPSTVGPVAAAAVEDDLLLVTRHVSTKIAERLKDLGIQFLDSAGNTYIREPGVLIWVSGRRPEHDPSRVDQPSRAFRPTGLRIIFGLLSEPSLTGVPHRMIADAVKVSLGSVPPVIRELRELGFVAGPEDDRRLVGADRLLSIWAEAYARWLRPKLLIGRFIAEEHNWWKDVDPAKYAVLWGSEVAAAMLTHHIRPETVTIYADTHPHDLMRTARLRKDEHGSVDLRKRFWRDAVPSPRPGLVPLPLVYADLLAIGDARALETAQLVREEYLARSHWPA